VELYWLPLGAGDTSGCVRANGRIFEAVVAHRQRRRPADLYHSALMVRLDGACYAIEMAGGRAPGWAAGLTVAARATPEPSRIPR
jgi:hypothetical protein